nr:NADP-dependent isocitrate dehydrogenase [Verrucomicrobiota bacterium]
APIAAELASNEESIVREMIDVQGPAADLGGYYLLDEEKTSAVMRPSSTFNAIIAKLG